eukprot:7751632-Alexandrium_andersonii.AAC.1
MREFRAPARELLIEDPGARCDQAEGFHDRHGRTLREPEREVGRPLAKHTAGVHGDVAASAPDVPDSSARPWV